MDWLAYLAMAAGLLPVILMAFGYLWVAARRRRASRRKIAGGEAHAADPGAAHAAERGAPEGQGKAGPIRSGVA